MATEDEFGRAVFRLKLDDQEYRRKLEAAEKVTDASTRKMEASFDRMQVRAQSLATAASVSAAGVSALGAAASVTGNQALATAAAIGAMGVAITALASAAVTGGAAMKAMAAASLAFLATPIGIVVTAIAAAISIAVVATRAWSAELKEADERLEEIRDTLQAKRQAIDKATSAVRFQIQVEKGLAKASDALPFEVRILTEKLNQLKASKALKAAAEATGAATVKRVVALQREAQILRGEKESTDFIVSNLERMAILERDRARSAKDAADAKEREKQAAQSLIQAQGPQTPGAARAAVREARDLVNASQRATFLVRNELESFIKRMAIGRGEQALLEKQLARFLPAADAAQGDRGRTGFIEAADLGRTGGFTLSDPAENRRRQQEEKRTKAAEDSARLLAVIAGRRVGVR